MRPGTYEELDKYRGWLKEQPKEKLLEMKQRAEQSLATERGAYESVVQGEPGVRGWLKRTFGPGVPPLHRTQWGPRIDEFSNELSDINEELRRREKEEGQK